MPSPLPRGDYVVSIATGFVGETFRGNTIDARGSSVAVDLDLVGNHFGTRVLNNHLLCAAAFQVAPAPTERPVHWGWSHPPMLGIELAGNVLEDSPRGGAI